MRASSSRFAPMSSDRTPTRAGFKKVWVKGSLLTKAFTFNEAFVLAQGLHTHITFAAPMVGASPDNIGAQRLAEGGVPASGAGSAREMTYRAERAQSNRDQHQRANTRPRPHQHHASRTKRFHLYWRLCHLCHSRHASKVAKMAA